MTRGPFLINPLLQGPLLRLNLQRNRGESLLEEDENINAYQIKRASPKNSFTEEDIGC